jgi:hypothetical protein
MDKLPHETREWIRLVRCPALIRRDVAPEASSVSEVSFCPWAEHHGEEAAAHLVVDTAANRWCCLDTGEGGPAFAVTWRMEDLPRTEVLALCLEHRPVAPSRIRRGV